MTKKAISPLGDTVAIKRDRREQSNKSNWKKGLRKSGGRKYAGTHLQGVETSILLK